jgi:ferritin-like metal-binding protein YciE
MHLQTLQDLFVSELRDLYNAENQLVKALPKMAKAAHSPQLRNAIQEHLEQTRHQVDRLTECFEKLGQTARGRKYYAMRGLIEEGEDIMDESAEPDVMDAGIIAAAQKVEHYEIASYGTVCTWAERIGQHEILHLLQETLNEEKATDEKLTHLAEMGINQAAMAGGRR